MPPTLYILYNANASLLGKFNYGYRKLTSASDKPACAACDITHGGLRLEETKAWKEAKGKLMGEGWTVRQLHRDELGGEIKGFVEREGLKFPVVVAADGNGDGKGGFRVLMEGEEMAGFGGDAGAFVERVREKGGIGGSGPSL